MEHWKPIPGFERVYEASSFGRIRIVVKRHNIRAGTVLAQCPDKNGYLLVRLSLDGSQAAGHMRRVSRVIAETFIGPIGDDLQVNHLDGVRTDNRPENLEICTARENVRHSIDVLGSRIGEKNHASKLTEVDVLALRLRAAEGHTFAALGRVFRISAVAAGNIAKGRTWKHVGGPRVSSRPKGRPRRK